MKLERALQQMEGPQLEGVLRFWEEDEAVWPVTVDQRRTLLTDCMTDRDCVAGRLSSLSERLNTFLAFLMRAVEWNEAFALRSIDTTGLPVEPHEVDAVGMALSQRGFLCRARGWYNYGSAADEYVVPEELGYVMSEVLGTRRRAPESVLSLHVWLRMADRKDLAGTWERLGLSVSSQTKPSQMVEMLATPEQFEARCQLIEDEDLQDLIPMLVEHGGILEAGTLRRWGYDPDSGVFEEWGAELESLLLGSFDVPDLANAGLRANDGWLVLYSELANTRLAEIAPHEDDADEDRQMAPDALGDVMSIAADIEKTPFKVKKGGEFYKTGVKRLAKKALSPGYRPRGKEADVEFFVQFLIDSDLAKRDEGGQLAMTPLWRRWERRDIVARQEQLMEYGWRNLKGGISDVHATGLRKAMMRFCKEQGIGRWVGFNESIFIVRNRYLRETVRPDHARRYQDRHKNAPFPALASPDDLQFELSEWFMAGLVRLGLVEVSLVSGEDRPWAWQLSQLGGVVLGLSNVDSLASQDALVVNPDHEVIVFTDVAGFQLSQEVGRFATRTKADFAVHFILTQESVQAGVAAGLDAESILLTLQENSSHAVPQNVEFSITEWAAKVIQLEARRSWLIQADEESDINRLMETKELKAMEARRLSPLVVELGEDPTRAGIVEKLQERGFYL